MSYNQYNAPVVIPAGSGVVSVHSIRDYLAWSIVNLCCGWGIGGVLPLIFSLLCRDKMKQGDVAGAQSMSTLALIFNIFVTIGGAIGWIIFIIMMILLAAAASTINP